MNQDMINKHARIFGLVITSPIFILFTRLTNWHPLLCAGGTLLTVIAMTALFVFVNSFITTLRNSTEREEED